MLSLSSSMPMCPGDITLYQSIWRALIRILLSGNHRRFKSCGGQLLSENAEKHQMIPVMLEVIYSNVFYCSIHAVGHFSTVYTVLTCLSQCSYFSMKISKNMWRFQYEVFICYFKIFYILQWVIMLQQGSCSWKLL